MIRGLENGEVVYNLLKLRVPGKPGPLEFDEKIAWGSPGGGMVTLEID